MLKVLFSARIELDDDFIRDILKAEVYQCGMFDNESAGNGVVSGGKNCTGQDNKEEEKDLLLHGD